MQNQYNQQQQGQYGQQGSQQNQQGQFSNYGTQQGYSQQSQQGQYGQQTQYGTQTTQNQQSQFSTQQNTSYGYGSQQNTSQGYGSQQGTSQGYGSQQNTSYGYGSQQNTSQGYGNTSQGYGQSSQGYGQTQGYGNTSQGYGSQQQNTSYGYGSQQNTSQGYGSQQQGSQGGNQYGSQQQTYQYNQNQVQYQSGDVISQTFTSIDINHSGRLSGDQLRDALSQLNKFKFSSQSTNAVLRMFDKDKSGFCSLDEFKQIYQYVTQLQHVFTQYDKDHSGNLSQSEVYSALNSYGFGLDSQTFTNVYNSFDNDKTGSLGFDEYIQMCLYLGNAKNIFNYLDKNRSGQITLSLNQWINWTSYFN